jgi:hypothetical protein
MSPDKFMKLYESLDKKYTAEVAAEAFGFVDEDVFRRMTKQMAAALPKELQGDFQKAAKEIKTIDGLSKLLNTMFSKYGNTLPYGYMVFDYGGKDSTWLRMGNETKKALHVLGHLCIDNQRSMDDLLGGLVRLAAAGGLKDQLLQLIAATEAVEIPEGFGGVPTKDALEAV